MHRNGGVKVGQLEGGTRDQEGGVNLVSPPGCFLFEISRSVWVREEGRKVHSLSHFPCVASLVCVRDEVEEEGGRVLLELCKRPR